MKQGIAGAVIALAYVALFWGLPALVKDGTYLTNVLVVHGAIGLLIGFGCLVGWAVTVFIED